MREAAFEIALGRSDFGRSFAETVRDAAIDLLRRFGRRRRAAADLEHLREMDAARLADLGLTPADFVGLGADLDPLAATRRLARLARRRSLADRWEAP
ncbi:MAG: hypothetical protein LWW93_10940 [Hyphomicrobiales bacterium]|nr:hypothetical protein [Hyphomicrobiales bacterium]